MFHQVHNKNLPLCDMFHGDKNQLCKYLTGEFQKSQLRAKCGNTKGCMHPQKGA